MPRHAPTLECSAEDKASLILTAKSRTEEARAVERARIVLACLEGKEIQQVARELNVSIPSVSKWRRRFSSASATAGPSQWDIPGGGVCSSRDRTRLRNAVSYLTGLPGRNWSRSPLSPPREKRRRHLETEGMETFS